MTLVDVQVNLGGNNSFRQIVIILLGETLADEIFRRAKFSSLFKEFVTFTRQS